MPAAGPVTRLRPTCSWGMSTSGMNALSASNRATVAVRTERFAWTVSTFRMLRARESASRMDRPGAWVAGGGSDSRLSRSLAGCSGNAGGSVSVWGGSIAWRSAGNSPARSSRPTTDGSRRASAVTAIRVLVTTPSSFPCSPHAIAAADDGRVVDADRRRHPRADSILVVIRIREPNPHR